VIEIFVLMMTLVLVGFWGSVGVMIYRLLT
jgi:hypothetical protein